MLALTSSCSIGHGRASVYTGIARDARAGKLGYHAAMKSSHPGLLFLCAAALAGCAGNPWLSNELRMTARELTEHVEKRFPVERSVAGLVDITFAHPVMTTNDVDKRLNASFDMTVRVPLSPRILAGRVSLSGRPAYAPETRGLFLKDARVDQMTIENMSEALSGALAKVASQLAKSQFEEKPFHTFKPEDFTRYGMRYEPASIEIRGDALVLTLQK